MPKSQRSWDQSQHRPTQWNLRGGRWSSVEWSTRYILKNLNSSPVIRCRGYNYYGLTVWTKCRISGAWETWRRTAWGTSCGGAWGTRPSPSPPWATSRTCPAPTTHSTPAFAASRSVYLAMFRIRMDPHHFGKLDPDPHQSGKLNPDPHQSGKLNPHQSQKQDPDPHEI